ncbi:MAG: type IV secretion system DNA-binding domain-containing protein, partial [Patescibacteria group bacterium]
MDDTVFFAKTNFRGKNRAFGIKSDDRRRHMYVLGKTGTGKTTVLENMILQDIRMGHGIAMVDPHGESAEKILDRIPEERIDDVVYFNPADNECPVSFNILEVPDPKYKHLIASDLMGVFTKLWAGVWSARMEYILNNCVLALLDTPGSTLLGIMRILVDRDYRQNIVANIKDPVVKSFWVNEYERWQEKFRSEAIAPIQNKVGQFLSTAIIRNIVGQSQSTINIPEIMNKGKILIVNVAKGRIGEDNSALLGAMLITKIQLAAMERVRVPEKERIDFYLYVDEFQNFATKSFASILSEARKYKLNLIISHQYIGQLMTDVSTEVRDAVFGNVGTMIIFRIGATDAEFLENEFAPEFTQQDLVCLSNFSIYLKLMVDGTTSRPFSADTLPPFSVSESEGNMEKIIVRSRELYGKSRPDVEKEIEKWSGGTSSMVEFKGSETRGKFKAVCWNCSKETGVSFEPDGVRPIYCKDCLNKVQTGEIRPIPSRRFVKTEERKEYEIDLGVLGIGVDDEKSGVAEEKYRAKPSVNIPTAERFQKPTQIFSVPLKTNASFKK